jgi:ABC-2 type transport system permease protein
MIFGIVLGVVLSHILVQSVFYYDIRKCLKGKLSMLACVAVTAGFVLIMRYDVFGYDTYLPKEKKIESVGIEVNNLDGYRGAYIYTLEGGKRVSEVEDMKLTDISAIYPYLESLIADNEAFCEYINDDSKSTSATMGDVERYSSVRVVYRLKNGKEVYRSYMAKGMREDLFRPVFESGEFNETVRCTQHDYRIFPMAIRHDDRVYRGGYFQQ